LVQVLVLDNLDKKGNEAWVSNKVCDSGRVYTNSRDIDYKEDLQEECQILEMKTTY
jgi:hypothetical protein